ncbi:SpoIIE family protein phosphatase [Streptomyces sp. NPDC008121]|uniref:PP2C family protein-serine/threonine phosphatase n=1 Tax=Streptomyces sp. NPDC008121 TaxID=3364809 RepID=UPI0036E6E807
MTTNPAAKPPGAGEARSGPDSVARLTAEIGRLRAERARRHLLDLATGVLAVQLNASPADAAAHLDALAHATGLDVEDLAADVVNGLAGSPLKPPTAPGHEQTDAGHTPPEPTDEEREEGAAPGHEAGAAPPGAARETPEEHAARITARHLAEARRARRAVSAAETADTVGEAARTLLEGGLAPYGAESLWLWRRADMGCLRLAGHAGVSAAEAALWQWIPPAGPRLFREVLADGSPAWLETGHDDVLPGPGPRAARALLPLRVRGTTAGLALVCWPGPLTLEAPLRRALMGLMEVAGTVLDAQEAAPAATPVLVDVLDALVHPAMLLHTPSAGAPPPVEPAPTSSSAPAAQAPGPPASTPPTIEHLNEEAVEALGAAPPREDRSLALALPAVHADLAHLARRAHRSARVQRAALLPVTDTGPSGSPRLCDVRVLPAGAERTVVLWHTANDPGLATGRAVARLQSVATFQDSLTGGETIWSEQAFAIFGMSRDETPVPLLGLRGRVHPEDGVALTALLTTLTERHTGAQTVLRVLLGDGTVRHVRVAAEPLLDGRTVGGIAGVYQDVSASRRTEAALNATFDHLTAVQGRAEIRHRLALQLQQAIVPEVPDLQEVPGLMVAARYRPAAEEYRVGGDWYDVLPLPGGKVLVAVGDIAGHGITSVNGMVALRNAQRGLAFTGNSPRHLMRWLNELTLRTTDHPTATAVCALYDPEDHVIVWTSAGHLPPLLIREGRARLLDAPHDVLLGAVPAYEYKEQRTRLRAGDRLLLYTDGLVERRHDGLDRGLAHLVREAERQSRHPLDRLVDGLLRAAGGDTDDDTSIVAVQVL